MEIKYNQEKNALDISLTVPLVMTGEDTYGDGQWKAPAVCVHINDHLQEYGLYYTQYLDYKSSLQATAPIVFFDSKKEALKAAEDFQLPVEYAPTPSNTGI